MVLPLMAHLKPLPLLTVIGCGNTNRCDDGVGSRIAAHYHRRIIDASRSGSEPGSLYEVPGTERVCRLLPTG
jgi:Ni,Fe-hydrogenase maturation factor